MKTVEETKELARRLRELFPNAHVCLTCSSDGTNTVSYFGKKTYAEATEWLRELGAGKREKKVSQSYSAIDGKVGEITFTAFMSELPPTCRKVTVTERVPKTQTVETGEFIEIQREVIKCDGNHDSNGFPALEETTL